MLYVPQGLLEVVFLVWIISALIRTLSYLKMKRQAYKLAVMKLFSIIFTIGVSVYILIRVAKLLFEIFNQD